MPDWNSMLDGVWADLITGLLINYGVDSIVASHCLPIAVDSFSDLLGPTLIRTDLQPAHENFQQC